jgi:hypothetical protein
MPVAGGEDRQTALAKQRGIAVQHRYHRIAARHSQGSPRNKTALDIDDDQGIVLL